MNLLGIFPNVRVFISIMLSILYVKLNYEVNLSKALTIPLVYWMMLIGIEALSISSIVYVNNIDVSVLLSPNLYRLETIILSSEQVGKEIRKLYSWNNEADKLINN